MSAAQITGVAAVPEILSSVEKTGARAVNDQLVELATKFKEAAKVIDPSINGAWFGHEASGEGQLFFVHLVRAGDQFLPPKPSEIEALFRQWKVLRDGSYAGLTQAECDERHGRYTSLQRQIVDLTPTTARELAMQFVAETDENDSDWRNVFFEKVNALAGNTVTEGFR